MINDDAVAALLNKSNFDVRIQLIKRGHRSLWLQGGSYGDRFIVSARCLYLDMPTVFHCDYISTPSANYLDSFRMSNPAYKTYSCASRQSFLLFHEAQSAHLLWFESIQLYEKNIIAIEKMLEDETRKAIDYLSSEFLENSLDYNE